MTDTPTDAAPCSKCSTEIPTGADRCPECGHEPGSSIIAKAIYYLFAVPFTILFGLLIVAGVVGAIVGEISISELIGAVLASALMGAVPFWYFRRHRHRRRIGPTE